MNVIEAYKIGVSQNYAKFSGRAGRKEFCSFLLVQCSITLILFIPHIFHTKFGYEFDSKPLEIYQHIIGLYMLLTIVPLLAILVRRMHDSGRSGWNLLLFFVPIFGLFYLVVILFYMIDESDDGENKWGENPKFSL